MVFKRFEKHQFGFCKKPNWYLPVHLGGYGLDEFYAPPLVQYSREQRQLAAMFVADSSLALYRMKSGMSIKTCDYYGALANLKMVPGDYVLQEFETFDNDNEWLGRLAYAARLQQDRDTVGKQDEVFKRKFKVAHRLSPMSLEGLRRYWEVRFVSSLLPTCPPLSILK
jgi:hypothetical protein